MAELVQKESFPKSVFTREQVDQVRALKLDAGALSSKITELDAAYLLTTIWSTLG